MKQNFLSSHDFKKLSFMKTNSEINRKFGHEQTVQIKVSVFSTAVLLYSNVETVTHEKSDR